MLMLWASMAPALKLHYYSHNMHPHAWLGPLQRKGFKLGPGYNQGHVKTGLLLRLTDFNGVAILDCCTRLAVELHSLVYSHTAKGALATTTMGRQSEKGTSETILAQTPVPTGQQYNLNWSFEAHTAVIIEGITVEAFWCLHAKVLKIGCALVRLGQCTCSINWCFFWRSA